VERGAVRLLVDPDTGELLEVLDATVIGLEPYGYREAKAAHMRASRERRDAVKAYTAAIKEVGAAEREYRMVIAQEMILAKEEYGATMAESVAKGSPRALEARERFTIADGMRYAALELIRTCDGDRTGVTQLVKWSEAEAHGPWGQGGE
jgi:hypothetical protein